MKFMLKQGQGVQGSNQELADAREAMRRYVAVGDVLQALGWVHSGEGQLRVEIKPDERIQIRFDGLAYQANIELFRLLYKYEKQTEFLDGLLD